MLRAAREGRKLPVVLRHLLTACASGGLVVDIEGRIVILQPAQVEGLERRARAKDGSGPWSSAAVDEIQRDHGISRVTLKSWIRRGHITHCTKRSGRAKMPYTCPTG